MKISRVVLIVLLTNLMTDMATADEAAWMAAVTEGHLVGYGRGASETMALEAALERCAHRLGSPCDPSMAVTLPRRYWLVVVSCQNGASIGISYMNQDEALAVAAGRLGHRFCPAYLKW